MGGEKEQSEVEKTVRKSLRFYNFDNFGQKWVPEKYFEASNGAKLIGMKCWSVWDTSRGLKPSKIAEKCDFARKAKKQIPVNKTIFPKQKAGPHTNLPDSIHLRNDLLPSWRH